MPRGVYVRPTLWDRVEAHTSQSDGDGCLLWTGCCDRGGYAQITYLGKSVRVHRLIVERRLGRKLEPKETVDHTCHNRDGACFDGSQCKHRRCLNEYHLEVVPIKTNTLRGKGITAENYRKEFCSRGHKYSGVNANGSRICVECEHLNHRSFRARRLMVGLCQTCGKGTVQSGAKSCVECLKIDADYQRERRVKIASN